MEIILHRINTIAALKTVPRHFGCEIDIRANRSQLILNHDPYKKGELFLDYLDEYKHGTLALNIKEAGIEQDVLTAVRARGISAHFLLDVEFPYLYRAAREGERSIAVRYSEDEPIELYRKYSTLIDWLWIDTNTKLPLNAAIVEEIKAVNTCLVCPERWGRPQDILDYRRAMKKLNFEPTAVMTNKNFIDLWQQAI